METSEYLQVVLAQLAFQTPLILVWAVAIGIAITRRRIHPRTSLLVAMACGIEIVRALAGASLSVLPLYLHRQGMTPSQIGIGFTVVGAVQTFISVGAWVLILVAIFGKREPLRE